MAYPFEPLTTEKLNSYFRKKVDSNCRDKETNRHNEKAAGNELAGLSQRLQTKPLREINS